MKTGSGLSSELSFCLLCASVPLWLISLREYPDQQADHAGFGQQPGRGELRRVAKVRHRVARPALAGVRVEPAARVRREVLRPEQQVLAEAQRRDERLDRPQVPPV